MGILSKTAKAAVRIGLVLGAVKVSIDNNIWSLNSTYCSEYYDKLKKSVLPGTIVYPKELPSSEEFQVNVGSKWNKYVNCAFSFINSFSSEWERLLDKTNAIKYLNEKKEAFTKR